MAGILTPFGDPWGRAKGRYTQGDLDAGLSGAKGTAALPEASASPWGRTLAMGRKDATAPWER